MLGVALSISGAQAQSSGSSGSGGSGGSFGFVGQKAQIKKASRWTLEEWLATKERMGWSNLWLSFNSPTPYEFFLLGAYAPEPGQTRYALGAYAQGVGIEFERENIFDPAWNARFHLRIFGVNVQNTNLTLYGGIRGRNDAGSYRQGYYGASLTFYLRKFFGIFGQYRYHAGSTTSERGKVTGSRWEAGPFLDFGPVRVFGYYLSETENATAGTLALARDARFWNLGAQLFF